MPEKSSTREHWNSFWERKKDFHEVYSNTDRVIRNLMKLTDFKDKIVLEVGAGTGRDSFTLAQYGAKVIQLDYSEPALRIITSIAREEKIPVQPLCGNAFSLPFQDHSIDIVFHQGLLEHFHEPEAEKLLSENVRVLKEGGFLLVDVPQRWHIYTLMKHILIYFNKWFAGWEREFSIIELRTKMEKHGLKIVHQYGELMYPSLAYRVFREGLLRFRVRLPLYPRIPILGMLREKIRARMRDNSLLLYIGISIGVVGCKSKSND